MYRYKLTVIIYGVNTQLMQSWQETAKRLKTKDNLSRAIICVIYTSFDNLQKGFKPNLVRSLILVSDKAKPDREERDISNLFLDGLVRNLVLLETGLRTRIVRCCNQTTCKTWRQVWSGDLNRARLEAQK